MFLMNKQRRYGPNWKTHSVRKIRAISEEELAKWGHYQKERYIEGRFARVYPVSDTPYKTSKEWSGDKVWYIWRWHEEDSR